MHFNRFLSTIGTYFKVCIEAQKIRLPFFPCQSLLLSTIILNDICKAVMCVYVVVDRWAQQPNTCNTYVQLVY